MTATKNSVLLYATHEALLPEIPSLVDQLNQPNRQSTQPYNLPDVIQPAPFPTEDQIAASLDSLNDKHRSWIAQNDLDVNRAPNASLFIVADEDTLHSRTVQVVYLGSDVENHEKRYDVLRSPISAAVQVFTTIDGGQHGWDEFLYQARANGGVIPSFGSQAPPAASDQEPPRTRKTLPTKSRD
ncbi:hypothetical protein WG66_004917 [Moniliophthora roreri]|uniref:Uncharacterized protein n=1 Tax=Moniliophthora roreri TaxID=221103 RepID=A0A0W0EUT6_MONRR|nr:hypothetical protein WG66_004917 [Moniliophthora roreri]